MLAELAMWLERAERIRTHRRNTQDKRYALHTPEVGCIAKGEARHWNRPQTCCRTPVGQVLHFRLESADLKIRYAFFTEIYFSPRSL